MKDKIFFFLIAVILVITSCTFAPTPTPTPTPVPSLAPTATPIPEPIAGTIFWDANGSGLQDETSFIIPEFDPVAPPYFFELLAANGTNTTAFNPSELATVPEPPIPGIGICLGNVCTETDESGTFTLQPEQEQDTYQLTFTDPNADDPTKAFRYINKWNGPVVIESYEINGVTVPEQHLNDTEVINLHQGLSNSMDMDLAIGFIQGYLTIPFSPSQIDKLIIWNGFDILNTHNESIGYWDRQGKAPLK